VIFDAWTQNETNPLYQQIQFYIQVFDSVYSRGPDFVKSITIKAPDGSLFSVDPRKDWLHTDQAYWKTLFASNFPGKKILGGTYSVTVYPNSGSGIFEADSVALSFLPVSNVTFPANGATGIVQTPTFTWTSVSGAYYYRLMLWDKTNNEPVYWTFSFGPQMRTDFNYFAVPPGVFKPNRDYTFRVEARSAAQDLDARSRSNWVNFRTGSW
jgi:hypothetical protein